VIGQTVTAPAASTVEEQLPLTLA
ncbi:uncharacterized protein METZ01_LOCUS125475, partial [marine metagenome]